MLVLFGRASVDAEEAAARAVGVVGVAWFVMGCVWYCGLCGSATCVLELCGMCGCAAAMHSALPCWRVVDNV